MISKIQDIPTENQISMVYFDTLQDDDTPIQNVSMMFIKMHIPYTKIRDTIFDLVIPFFWGLFNRFSHNATIIVNHSHFSFDTNLTTRYHFYLHNGAVLSLHSAILLTIAMIQIIQTKNQFQKLFCTLIYSTDLLIKPIPAINIKTLIINIKTLLNNINFHWGVNL